MQSECTQCGRPLCMIQRDFGVCQQCKDGKTYRTVVTK